ncbi:hypothetical protein AVI51_12375 [Piscirickettsia salmonis]|nr:queuosine precursor transporter [Piscirickettsia salmonis]APS43632.1 hypothetical protein AVI48_04100 [Piscirickettsia salmonis]APS46987.1 hypothetical protein AVI49_04710 [Piscirickettsia salmonis]APS51564.1 hypothetical protein AVI50_12485 [Piscirickettsia salmonis]APS54778.1 hypothetical protein AVI51_12375 [Piscirickettsia salmonis]
MEFPFMPDNFPIGGGVFIFPIAFILQDIVTEVYGYARSRQMMWIGMTAMTASVIYSSFIISLPTLPAWHQSNQAYQLLFGKLPIHTFGDVIGIICGTVVNDYVLSRSKLKLKGKFFGVRIISATMAGEFSYQIVAYTIAWSGQMDAISSILPFFIFAFFYKICFNIIALPFIYIATYIIKQREHMDVYDTKTNFNPFKFSIG